jgi:hypothetical protein
MSPYYTILRKRFRECCYVDELYGWNRDQLNNAGVIKCIAGTLLGRDPSPSIVTFASTLLAIFWPLVGRIKQKAEKSKRTIAKPVSAVR